MSKTYICAVCEKEKCQRLIFRSQLIQEKKVDEPCQHTLAELREDKSIRAREVEIFQPEKGKYFGSGWKRQRHLQPPREVKSSEDSSH